MKRFAKRRSIAISADGFICGAADNVSPFPQSGPIVEDCLERMSTYSCARMGRRTYESGWAYGLPSGAIYLCGGSDFADWLLSHGRIDLLRLKRAPIFYGSGVWLFGLHSRPTPAC
ncbi:MAG: hypothetical protein CMI60_10135 [Parvibaculum sp.]|nr:hypothetical protein [Parvibaculum sp.]